MGAPRKPKKSGSVGSAVTATAPYRGFVKVEREQLDHPMFRGHLDWIGAWLLVQAAADYRTELVNLTNVGRKVAQDFGWNNEKWRRFVMRLEKENFVTTVEKRNLGDTLGYRHVARVLDPKKEQGDMGRDIDALEGDPLVRNSNVDNDNAAQARSGRGSDEEPSDGAVGGVLKEQKTRTEKVVSSAKKDADAHTPKNNHHNGSERAGKEHDPKIVKNRRQELKPRAATKKVVKNRRQELEPRVKKEKRVHFSGTERVRTFLTKLVNGNFVQYLEEKIESGDYRPDLFEHWYYEYSEHELKEAWELALRSRNSRSNLPHGERFTFIDLLNDNIKPSDNADLRGWVRSHKEAKEYERLNSPTTYSNVRATRAYAEQVLENNTLPLTIDIFDDVSLEALETLVAHDEARAHRYDLCRDLFPDTSDQSVYFFINAAPNPKFGVFFSLKYMAYSKWYPDDDAYLVETLEHFEKLNMIECLDDSDGYVQYRPTDVSQWRIPEAQ